MTGDDELSAAEAAEEEARLQAEADALVVKRQPKIDKFRAGLAEMEISITEDVVAQLLGQSAFSKTDMLPAFGRERRRSK